MLVKPDLDNPLFMMDDRIIELIKQDKCPLCERDIEEEHFRGMESKAEYSRSGLCQVCFDELYLTKWRKRK